MSQKYKKIGATTDGYRGERAVLEERVIEGFATPNFNSNKLLLTPESEQTQYLTNSNFQTGYYIVLPKATELWNNWKTTIINNSTFDVSIFYYDSNTDDPNTLTLAREVTAGNMVTLILLDNTSQQGTWTTLRTSETVSGENADKYTTVVYDTFDIAFGQIQTEESSFSYNLSNIPLSTAVKSIYFKPTTQFTSSENDFTLTVSIGTQTNPNLFYTQMDITGAVSNTNFTKDVFERILSTSSDTQLIAKFQGSDLSALTDGNLQIVVERVKLIDPSILKNSIVSTQIPIGTIINYAFDDVPVGYIRLDGSMLDNAASVAPQFVEFLNKANNRLVGEKLIVAKSEYETMLTQYGSCGKFAWYGTSLRFPTIDCFVKGLGKQTQIVTQLAKITGAGLPNITGQFDSGSVWPRNPSGALNFTILGGGGGQDGDGWDSRTATFTFDASRSNSIYGNSKTVTPINIQYPYIMSVFNRIQWTSQADYDALIAASVDKANRSLNNVSDIDSAFKENSISWAMPDYDSAISVSTKPYTVLSDGWFMWHGDTGQGPEYLYINGIEVAWVAALGGSDTTGYTATIPVNKNDIISCSTNLNGIFYPCKGVN